jgi:hypothetical protein
VASIGRLGIGNCCIEQPVETTARECSTMSELVR